MAEEGGERQWRKKTGGLFFGNEFVSIMINMVLMHSLSIMEQIFFSQRDSPLNLVVAAFESAKKRCVYPSTLIGRSLAASCDLPSIS